jgi:NADH:ubiquinone oxidoreductase subunit 4 (subunit M)
MERYEVITLAPLLFLMVLVGVYPSSVLDTIKHVVGRGVASTQVLV